MVALAAALVMPAAQAVAAGETPAAQTAPAAKEKTLAADAKVDWSKVFQAIETLAAAYKGYEAAANAPLPPIKPVASWNYAQNLTPDQQDWYRTTPQGTYFMPYQWFLALEAPEQGKTFGQPPAAAGVRDLPESWRMKPAASSAVQPRFASPEYLARFGMLNQPKSRDNPDGLPAGLTRQLGYVDPMTANAQPQTVLGLGCALCHAGKVEYNGKALFVDGGPSHVNLDMFGAKFLVALLQTLLPDQLDVPPWDWTFSRFDRFAAAVLGTATPTELQKFSLYTQLLDFAIQKARTPVPPSSTSAGFSRLDALDAIGNQVFAVDAQTPGNVAASTAPVSYPMVWTVPWLAWAEYPGVVRNPMIRNVGEALGVFAPVNLTTSDPNLLYKSTAMVGNLHRFETLLMEGTFKPDQDADPWAYVKAKKELPGLRPPSWQTVSGQLGLPPIDAAKAEAGKKLYAELCQSCHLPPLNDPAIGAVDSQGNLNPVYWESKDADTDMAPKYRRQFLRVTKLNIQDIGTDPQEVVNFATRFPNMTNMTWNKWSGVPQPMATVEETMPDGSRKLVSKVGQVMSMADALKYTTQATANRWYADNKITDPDTIAWMEGYRPNKVLLEATYRARPLDGIWSTAPFLHNGSVANLYQLLLPAEKRATQFVVGLTELDPVNLGLKSYEGDSADDKAKRDELVKQGYTLFSVTGADGKPIPGNSNAGHEFKGDGKVLGNGIVGRTLTDTERYELIEYLKTL